MMKPTGVVVALLALGLIGVAWAADGEEPARISLDA